MATRLVKIIDDDVEVLKIQEKNTKIMQNIRPQTRNKLFHLKWNPFNEVKKLCRLPRLQRCFHGNYITGRTFNVHVAANSSTESNSQYNGLAKSKKQRFRRLRPLESSDSSQGDSQFVI